MLAHWVGVLYKGKMVEQGLGNQVMGNPQHDYTKQADRLPARSGPGRTGQAPRGVPGRAPQLTAGTAPPDADMPAVRGPNGGHVHCCHDGRHAVAVGACAGA